MTVTYVYCFSIVSLFQNYPKAISLYDIIQYAYGYTFHKNIFFLHNFLKKRRDFFTIFKRNDTIFHNWSGTGPFHNFGKKTLITDFSFGKNKNDDKMSHLDVVLNSNY